MINYFLVRAWMPVVAFLAYTLLGRRLKPVSRRIYQSSYLVIGVGIIILLLCAGGDLVILLKSEGPVYTINLYGANVTVQGAIFSLLFAASVLYLTHKITGDYLFPVAASILASFALGWLYEVPFYYPSNMFLNTNPLGWDYFYYPMFIHPQIMSILFLFFISLVEGFKVTRMLGVGIIIYVLYTYYMFNNSAYNGIGWSTLLDQLELSKWVIRLPSAFMLLTIFTKWEAAR